MVRVLMQSCSPYSRPVPIFHNTKHYASKDAKKSVFIILYGSYTRNWMTNRGVILLQFDLKCHWILVWPFGKFRNSRSEIEFCTVDWHEKIVDNINIVLFTGAAKISDFLASANLKISKIFVILTLTDLLISMNVQSNKTGHDESSWMSIFLRKNFLGTALKSSPLKVIRISKITEARIVQ